MAKSKAQSKSKKPSKPKSNVVEAAIAAAPDANGARDPGMPVRVLVAEAQRAAELAKPARAKLAKLASFDIAAVDDLVTLATGLVKVDLEWTAARATGRAGLGPKVLADAEGHKRDLFQAARFLLRKDAVVQERLDRIADGTGAADTAADLDALADLVREFPEVFASDDDFPKDAAEHANDLATKIRTGTDPSAAVAAQQRRNKLYWAVSDANAEVRTALRYLWRKDPKKLALIGAGYAVALRKTARKEKKPA